MMIRDGNTVFVRDNDIDFAIKLLKRQVGKSRIFQTLKARAQHPGRRDRRRFKDLEAQGRLKRLLKKRENARRF